MKTRELTLIGIVALVLVSSFSYLQWGTGSPSQLHCMFNECSVDLGRRTVTPVPDPSMPITSFGLPSETILDNYTRQQIQRILDKCDYVQKLESGEIPWINPDGSFNVIRGDLPFFNNGTHYIDSNYCNWVDSLEAVTHICFEANPMEQNWYSGPAYFDNGTHHLDKQKCEWTIYSEEYSNLPLCDSNPEHDFGKCRELP